VSRVDYFLRTASDEASRAQEEASRSAGMARRPSSEAEGLTRAHEKEGLAGPKAEGLLARYVHTHTGRSIAKDPTKAMLVHPKPHNWARR